jgi:hypothetical protein
MVDDDTDGERLYVAPLALGHAARKRLSAVSTIDRTESTRQILVVETHAAYVSLLCATLFSHVGDGYDQMRVDFADDMMEIVAGTISTDRRVQIAKRWEAIAHRIELGWSSDPGTPWGQFIRRAADHYREVDEGVYSLMYDFSYFSQIHPCALPRRSILPLSLTQL